MPLYLASISENFFESNEQIFSQHKVHWALKYALRLSLIFLSRSLAVFIQTAATVRFPVPYL